MEVGMSWEITMVNLGLREKKQLEEVNRLGAEGWEPFAATYNPTSGHTIFLRQRLAAGSTGIETTKAPLPPGVTRPDQTEAGTTSAPLPPVT
jgi:hypothetical protein